jgi:hypothetical protein
MRGQRARRARRELRTDQYFLKPPLPRGRHKPDIAVLTARVDRIDRTIAALGEAAAEAIEDDNDAPALAQGLLELAEHVAEIRDRLARIEGAR